MKISALVLSLTLTAAFVSHAEEQTIDISLGRGQTVPYKAQVPKDVVTKGVRKEPAAKAKRKPGVLRPVTIQTVRGPVITMREFPQ